MLFLSTKISIFVAGTGCKIMEEYNIDKIAAPFEPERSEGSPLPGERPAARGTQYPDELQGSGEDPRGESAPQYGAQRSTGREAQDSGGPGVSNPRGEWTEFIERNRILKDEWNLIPVTSPEEYFRVLFTRGGVNYMQETGQSFWGDHHYNAIAYDLRPFETKDKKTGAVVTKYRAKKYDITRTLDECVMLTVPEAHRVISSPILYAGQSRKAERARSIWGIAIDLDDVQKHNLADIAWWINHLDRTPMPSMIVSSGNGLHLYYLFPMGVGTHKSTVKTLQRLKHNITQFMWNGLFSSDPNPDLHQGIWQGFRIPGTPTKRDGYKVVGFVPEVIPYYTVRELNTWFQPDVEGVIDRDARPLSEKEILAVEEDRYLPSAVSFQEAKERWPDWEPGKAPGQWVSNRRLYDWWLRLIRGKDRAIVAGRRYYWVLALVAFAKKCQIPYEELEADAYSLLDQMEALTVKEDNHFTASDIEDALRSYRYTGERSLARYKKNYIGAKTGYYFPENKRNGRTREQNLMIARAARDVDMKSRGLDRWQGSGRTKMKNARLAVEMWCGRNPYNCNKTQCAKECIYTGYEIYTDDKGKKHRRRVQKHLDPHTVANWWWRESPNSVAEAILKWRAAHPGNENKSQCARECGISRPSVIKWWNCTPEDAETVRSEKSRRQRQISAAAAAKQKTSKFVDGYKLRERDDEEDMLHDSAEIMYNHAVAHVDAEPQPGDKERLEELFKGLISMLPPDVNREEFLKEMMSKMPEYFAQQKKE